ncbi:MAG: toll/interleukin-1 receptor domain-containing protein [Rhodomicrobium sp.]
MGTIREYFDTELREMAVHKDWQLRSVDGAHVANIVAKIAYNFDANAKYWYFFVPQELDAKSSLAAIMKTPETEKRVLGPDGDGLYVETAFANYSERQNNSTLIFTRRINLYVDADLTPLSRQELKDLATQNGFFLAVKDREYARRRTGMEKPLAFISHDYRDKEDFVRGLAVELSKLMCLVWYDEFSLKVGDSLRENIERGLREARKCILVLSPNFLANKGWGKAEFDSIYTREIVEGKNVILPVWHNITKQELYEYSPRLVDKYGIQSTLGAIEVARQLYKAISS